MPESKPLFADVIPFKRLPGAASVFTYRIPEEMTQNLHVGTFVKIPFRRGQTFGVIASIASESHFSNIKNITDKLEEFPSWSEAHIRALLAIAHAYNASAATLSYFLAPQILQKRSGKETRADADSIIHPPKIEMKQTGNAFPFQNEKHSIIQFSSLSQKVSAYKQILAQESGSVLIICPQTIDAQELYQYLKHSPKQVIYWKGHDQNKTQQAQQWQEMKNSNCLVIGTRSALFAPIPDLKTIIVDQAEKSEHKQWDALPLLDNRIAADYLAKELSAGLIFSSSVPRIEQLQSASIFNLTGPKPSIHVIHHEKRSPLLHPMIHEAIEEGFEQQKSSILIVSHKGMGRTLHCLDCHKQWHCQNCGKNLQVFADRLKCPSCQTSIPLPSYCPGCKGQRFMPFGVGIQGVMTELHQTGWRSIPVASELIDQITSSAEPALYITTPGLLKRLFYQGIEKIAEVVLFHPETHLFAPDYRANEQFYAAFQQAAIDAKDYFEANLTVQTRLQEETPLLRQALTQDYRGFLKDELAQRKMLGFPPFKHAARLIWRNPLHGELPQLETITRTLTAQKPRGLSFVGPLEQSEKGGKSFIWEISSDKQLSDYDLDKSLKSVYSRLIIDLTPFP